MAHPGPGEAKLLVPGRHGPAIIGHGGGNSARHVDEFLAAGADFLEVDLWLHAGRLEARHERRIKFTPILFEKWYLRRAPRPHFGLDELLAASGSGSAGIFLDLKNGGAATVAALDRALSRLAARPRIVASSQQWATLRALSVHLPEVDTFYSVDVPAKLDLFRSVTDRDGRPAGVSCRHSLLTRALVRELIDRGLMVVAWTVDDPVRARELVEWGVHGITTHRVAEMRAEFGR